MLFLSKLEKIHGNLIILFYGSLSSPQLQKICFSTEKATTPQEGHFVNQHPTSRQTSHIPHPEFQTSHILNILHPEHPTSWTSHISNIPHPKHPTSWTSYIPNIPHPHHPLSQHSTSHSTSHIHTISHLEHPIFQTSHILNIPHPQHPTSLTAPSTNIQHSEHLTSQISHIPNISHHQLPTSPISHNANIPHSQHTAAPKFRIAWILSSHSTNFRIHASESLNIHLTIFKLKTDRQQSKSNTRSFIV